MTTFAITGSSGMIGSALRQHLESAGHEVVRVRRGNPSDPSATWNPETGWVREGALDGVDVVIHLAGANIGEKRWNAARKRELSTSRIEATRLLVDHLATLQRKPAVLVSASAIGYYGSRGDETLTEESGQGSGFLADLVGGWEREAARAEDLGIRTVLVRTGLVLARHDGVLKRMLPPFKLGLGGRIGNGRAWFSWVTLADTVRIFEYAATSDLRGPVNASAPNPVTNADFTRALGRALHRPTLFPVPPLALKVMFGGEMANETLLASQRVRPARLLAAGFAFQHETIDEGLAAALA